MKPIKKGEQKNIFNSVDALDKLKVFRGRIPTNFDFKQELASARDEKKRPLRRRFFRRPLQIKQWSSVLGGWARLARASRVRRLSTRSRGSPGTSPGQALDPTGAGYTKTPTQMSGRDYKGGSRG